MPAVTIEHRLRRRRESVHALHGLGWHSNTFPVGLFSGERFCHTPHFITSRARRQRSSARAARPVPAKGPPPPSRRRRDRSASSEPTEPIHLAPPTCAGPYRPGPGVRVRQDRAHDPAGSRSRSPRGPARRRTPPPAAPEVAARSRRRLVGSSRRPSRRTRGTGWRARRSPVRDRSGRALPGTACQRSVRALDPIHSDNG